MKKFLPKSITNPQGFTLIELMVVITIIAVLAIIGMVMYSGISARARDSKRMEEIDAIHKAMEKNYQPGATNGYQSLNQVTDFNSGLAPTDPLTGSSKCGTGNNRLCSYCLFAADTEFGEITADTCTVIANGIPAAATRGYVVCANLETNAGPSGSRYYCKQNSQ